MCSGFEAILHRQVLRLRPVPTLQGLSFPPVCVLRRLCRSQGLVGTGRGEAGAVTRASRAGSPGSSGHVCRPGGGSGFGAGGDRIAPDEPGSGSGGERGGPGGLREEVIWRAWLWTWLESPGGIQGPRHQGRPRARPHLQALVGSAPRWGPRRAAAKTASSSIPGLLASLWNPSPSPRPSWLRFHHWLLKSLFV